MRHWSCLLASSLLLTLVAPAFAAAPQSGQVAPSFLLQEGIGHWRSPFDFHGNWPMLYPHPKDFTRGCRVKVCSFRDDIAELHRAGADVVGITPDEVKFDACFFEKYRFPLPLLADVEPQKSATQVMDDLAALKVVS